MEAEAESNPWDEFYILKFQDKETVRPGWSMTQWLEDRWAGYPKTSTRNAHTVGRK